MTIDEIVTKLTHSGCHIRVYTRSGLIECELVRNLSPDGNSRSVNERLEARGEANTLRAAALLLTVANLATRKLST